MVTFKIWCDVWGGVTGSRAAWLKSNGEEIVFTDRSNAEATARRLTDSRMGSPNRVANFSYTVVEFS